MFTQQTQLDPILNGSGQIVEIRVRYTRLWRLSHLGLREMTGESARNKVLRGALECLLGVIGAFRRLDLAGTIRIPELESDRISLTGPRLRWRGLGWFRLSVCCVQA